MQDNNAVKNLMSHHFKILDLFLEGYKVSEIAKQVNLKVGQIYKIKNHPDFQHQLAVRRAERQETLDTVSAIKNFDDICRSKIDGAQEKAIDTLIYGMNSQDEKVAQKAAMELLDRGNYPRQQKIDATNKSVALVLSREDVQLIKDTAKQVSSVVS